MTESGKWIASSSSVRRARRSRPGATAASDIAAIRPGIEREARYSRDDGRGEPVAGVGGDRRDERPVLELADAPERLAELARVRLRAADHAGDERQQRDPDHAGELRRLRLRPNRAVIARFYNVRRCPGPSRRTVPAAGVSPAPEVDVEALVARLREELAGGPNGAGEGRRAAAGRATPGRAALGRVGRQAARTAAGAQGLGRVPGQEAASAAPPLVRRAARGRAAHVQRRRAEAGRRDPRGGRPRRAVAGGSRADARRAGGAADARSRGAAPARAPRRSPRSRPRPPSPTTSPSRAKMRGSTADVRERQRPYVEDFRDAASGARRRLRSWRAARPPPRRRDRGARNRRRRRHGRLRPRRGPRGRAGRRARPPRTDSRRQPGRHLRRPGGRAPAPGRALPLPRARSAEAPPGGPARLPRRSTRSRRSRSAPTSPT